MILAAIQQTQDTVKIVTSKMTFIKTGYLLNYTSSHIMIRNKQGQVWMVNEHGRNIRMLPMAPVSKLYKKTW